MQAFRTLATACIATAIIAAFSTLAHAAKPTALEVRIQRIEDRAEIERLLMEYGRSLDNRDFATYSQLFAENGEWKGGFGSFRGPAAIQAAMEKTFASAAGDIPKGSNFHVLTNAIIDIKGDRATASSKFLFVKIENKKPDAVIAGRYEDIFIREKGAWKFLQRVALSPEQVNANQPTTSERK